MEERYGKDIPINLLRLSPQSKKYTAKFCCGNRELDKYFRNKAFCDDTAVTYLFIDAKNDELVACITLACSAIFSANNKDQFSTILSAIEVLYFAVDESYQHIKYQKGAVLTLSHYIFSYMLNKMKEISHNVIGATKVVLYSVPEAVTFYGRCNFVEFGKAMYGDKGYFVDGCVPMYYDLN